MSMFRALLARARAAHRAAHRPAAPDLHSWGDSAALTAARDAEAALARLLHPATLGRYPAVTRDRLQPATHAARESIAYVRHVLDTSPGPAIPDPRLPAYQPDTPAR